MKRLILCLSVLSLAGCRYEESANCHFDITFTNRSGYVIYCVNSLGFTGNPLNVTSDGVNAKVPSNATRDIMSPPPVGHLPACLEDEGPYPVTIRIYDERVLRRYDWEHVKAEEMYMQEYVLSLEDLRRLDWTLSFPPDERMKDVQMWPLYNESKYYPPIE